jgi:cell wall-associated NlpC family hydrolase
VVAALAAAGCGTQQVQNAASISRAAAPIKATAAPTVPKAHPQAVEPIAGASGAGVGSAAATSDGSQTTPAAVNVNQGQGNLAQPLSDAQVRQQLAASGLTPSANQATLTPDGLAVAPVDAPPAVQEIIAAGNQIAHLPYVWGGGHGTYVDTGYDCSGSISFVFQAAGLLKSSMVSGDLAHWGAAGPGKWITVFANAGHTFMYVAGLRFDTVALAETGTRWSNRSADEGDLASFAVRHPAGL